MAPPPAAAAPARRHTSASPSRRWGRSATEGSGATAPATRRAPLRVVPPRSPRPGRGARRNPARLMTVIAVCLVVGALLANGQVRLSALQHTLSLEQAAHRQHELTVAQLETPARIVAAATNQLHM